MTLEFLAKAKTPSPQPYPKYLFGVFPMTIAQRFNAGFRSQEESKSHLGRKKRGLFAEANWGAPFVPERDFVWCAWQGPSVETLGYFHLRQHEAPALVIGTQTAKP
jgi:hypothetical protein